MDFNVLVTGGAGYIGSHTCKGLAENGFRPVAFDNLSRGHRWAVKWGPLEEGDIIDRTRVAGVLQAYRPCAVVHFAALTYVGESVTDPIAYYANNVAGTLSLIEAMLAHNIDKLVFSSSCAVYGLPAGVPIRESEPLEPISPYGNTKLIVERLLSDVAATGRLQSFGLRYFNAAGAEDAAGIGEEHAPETHLIPLAIAAALQANKTLDVLGTDYPTPDGTAIRDYVHVSDLAKAHVAALRYLLDGRGSAVSNVGTGNGASVLQIIDAVERATQRKVKWRPAPRRSGDPAVLVANVDLMKSHLRLQPSDFATLQDMVESAARWQEASDMRSIKPGNR